MTTPTLDDLLATPSQDDVLDQEVLPELMKRAVRATDWMPKAVYRAMSYVVSKMRADSRTLIAATLAAMFEDFAFGRVAAPGGLDVTGWAPFIAKQKYYLDAIPASYTRRLLTLANTSATSYGPLRPGDIILAFSTGNRYVLDGTAADPTATITIPGNGSVQAAFRAEYPCDTASGRFYKDSPGDAIVFVTSSFPGVTATNPAPTYTGVVQVGSGVGIVTPTGTPTGGHSLAVRIDTTGTVGGATVAWSTSLDGEPWVAQSGGSATNIGGTGIGVALSDNGGSPAFAAGCVFYFSSPGSDLIAVGRDAETPQELGARCQALWPMLAFAKDPAGNWIPGSPTMSAYEALARSASNQVKICFALTDATIANRVLLYLAGQGAPLSADTLAAVQDFLNHFSFLCDIAAVLSPTLRTITLGGATITVRASQLAAAQAALTRSLQIYFGGVDPARPLSVNGKIEHGYLVDLVEQLPGFVGFTDTLLTINGNAADLQLPVTPGAYELAQWAQSVAAAFAWVTV